MLRPASGVPAKSVCVSARVRTWDAFRRRKRSELDVVAESRDRFLVSGASGSLDPTDGLVLTPGPHDEFTICAAVVCSAALSYCRVLIQAASGGRSSDVGIASSVPEHGSYSVDRQIYDPPPFRFLLLLAC